MLCRNLYSNILVFIAFDSDRSCFRHRHLKYQVPCIDLVFGVTIYVTCMFSLLASIVSPPFKHILPCYVEDVTMAMVKASTPPRRLWELSYDYGVVDNMETEELEGMGDNDLVLTHSVVKSERSYSQQIYRNMWLCLQS